MANTSPLGYRIDSNLRINAEKILNDLGLTPTAAISMFYKQIIIQQGIPFEIKLNQYKKPLAIDSMSKEEFNHELLKGIQSLDSGKSFSADEVDKMLKEEFNI